MEAPYNNSVWFCCHSKYIASVFVVELLQRLHRLLTARGWRPRPIGAALTVVTAALTTPSAVQHVIKQRAADKTVLGRDVVATAEYIGQHAKPGDVVLASTKLVDTVLTLTKCRVPLSYFDSYLVSAADSQRRRTAIKEFWDDWEQGNARSDLLQELAPDYVATPKSDSVYFLRPPKRRGAKSTQGVLPPGITLAFENKGYVSFQVQRNP